MMKINPEKSIDILLNYGFAKINKEEEESDEEYVIANYDYKYEIGHSRRGQHYYLLVSEKSRTISLYASKPDGGGGSIGCPDVLLKLIIDGIIV